MINTDTLLTALPFVVFIVLIIFMMSTLFAGTFVRYFHLIDKRGLVTGESWEKVNVLAAGGDFSLRASEGMEGKRWNYISVGYEKSKGESVSKTFMGEDINKMINEAYEWAAKEGYLETPNEK